MTTLAEAAEVLKEVRRKERLTQTELADRAGLARSTVSACLRSCDCWRRPATT
jgi:DNA-binding XRE family transcriptional regulator